MIDVWTLRSIVVLIGLCESEALEACLQRCLEGEKAVGDHLAFVIMQRLGQRNPLVHYSAEVTREQAGVTQRSIGTRASGRHCVNGVTKEGDAGGLPGLYWHGMSHSQDECLIRLALLNQQAQN